MDCWRHTQSGRYAPASHVWGVSGDKETILNYAQSLIYILSILQNVGWPGMCLGRMWCHDTHTVHTLCSRPRLPDQVNNSSLTPGQPNKSWGSCTIEIVLRVPELYIRDIWAKRTAMLVSTIREKLCGKLPRLRTSKTFRGLFSKKAIVCTMGGC